MSFTAVDAGPRYSAKKKHNQASTTGSAVPNITQRQCAFYTSIQVGQQNFDLLLDTRAELTCVSPEID